MAVSFVVFSLMASLPGEIVSHARFYDYEAKYQDEATELTDAMTGMRARSRA